ncbi:hypothetical protein XENOCAPTIV_001255 [Xenoophorus captivus]|uniref:Uncharacterized protein n=1 Tax=Xenoophorus captivus TaxID=1517983 RepID=A0ABV0RN27_9TELE
MAAGFMTSRILLLCLLNEVTYASGLRASNTGYEAWQDGEKQEVHGYRRPLQYVRSLRQSKNNPEHLNQFYKWQNSQRSLKDLSRGQTLKQTMSHLWPQMSPVQPAPQRNNALVQPRGFKVSLDLPFFEQSQSKVNDSAAKGHDTKPKTNLRAQFQSGISIPEFQSPDGDSTKNSYVEKNIHGVSIPSLATPPAASVKPLKLTGGHAKNLKEPLNDFQTSYMVPGKQLSLIQMGLKWPISQTAGEQIKKLPSSMWSNYADTGPKKTPQRPYQSIFTQPIDDKLTISTWPLNQHKTPQQIRQEPPLARQSLKLQRPDSTKPPSLPVVKYLEQLGFKTKTSPTRKDGDDQIVEPYSTRKQYLPPLQSNRRSQSQEYVGAGSPSVVQTQSSSSTSGADIVKVLTKIQKADNDQDVGVQSLQLGFPFPFKTLLPNLTKSDGGYLKIKPESVGALFTHYMEAKSQSNSRPTELTLSVFGIDDAGHQRTNGHPERKWPVLNLDIGHQQKKHPPSMPVPTKPADNKPNFPSWSPSQQAGQDETASIQSWGPQKPKMGKPQFPVLAISKYLDLVDLTWPLKNDNSQITQPKPSPSERVQSLYSLLKPITSNVQDQTRPSVSRLFSSTHDIGPFKPSSDLRQNAEMTHSSSDHPPLTTYDLSPFNSPKLKAGPAKKPQTWQKPVSSPYLYQYNNGREASYDTTFENVPDLSSMPSRYQSQKKLLEQDNYGPNQDRNYEYASIFDTDGGDTVFGQTYQSKWTEKNTAGTPLNLQPLCESSSRLGHQGYFSDPHYPYLNAETWPCSPIPCMDGAGECFNETKKQSTNFPQWVNYSPKAEATSISVPSRTFKPFFSQSSYQPDQYSYNLKQYSVGQGHPQQPTRFKLF